MKITRVSSASGDWEYIYLDDKLIAEGHTVPLDTIITAIGMEFESIEVHDDWAQFHSRPGEERLSNIPPSEILL